MKKQRMRLWENIVNDPYREYEFISRGIWGFFEIEEYARLATKEDLDKIYLYPAVECFVHNYCMKRFYSCNLKEESRAERLEELFTSLYTHKDPRVRKSVAKSLRDCARKEPLRFLMLDEDPSVATLAVNLITQLNEVEIELSRKEKGVLESLDTIQELFKNGFTSYMTYSIKPWGLLKCLSAYRMIREERLSAKSVPAVIAFMVFSWYMRSTGTFVPELRSVSNFSPLGDASMHVSMVLGCFINSLIDSEDRFVVNAALTGMAASGQLKEIRHFLSRKDKKLPRSVQKHGAFLLRSSGGNCYT